MLMSVLFFKSLPHINAGRIDVTVMMNIAEQEKSAATPPPSPHKILVYLTHKLSNVEKIVNFRFVDQYFRTLFEVPLTSQRFSASAAPVYHTKQCMISK